jgi:ribosomal protein S18 acetylase RimI-like enzyme
MEPDALRIEEDADPRDSDFLGAQIDAHNVAVTGIDDYRALNIFVRGDDGAIVAGISGGTWGGYLEVYNLWVRADLRGGGQGSRLLAAAEREAAERGCAQVLLNSHSFQAPGFYLKHGYRVFGAFEGIGGRHTRYFLRKELSAG